jgi:8-oxo-dGTP pyrophosphatase MutT (NUDIX family)
MNITMLGPDTKKTDSMDCKIKTGCRAIIERDGQILFSFLSKRRQYLLPGGKLDPGETYEACVRRECREELGMIVQPEKWLCSVTDRYASLGYRNEYYGVSVLQEGLPVQFVEEEIKLGLEPVWLPKKGLVQWLVGRLADPLLLDGEIRKAVLNSHFREACALSVYIGEPLPLIPLHLKDTLMAVAVLP